MLRKNKGFPSCNLILGPQSYETRRSRCSVRVSNTGRQCERVLMRMLENEGEEMEKNVRSGAS